MSQVQFCVVYRMTLKQGCENAYIAAWKDMTALIQKHAGGLGSRLHRESDGVYLAYAQWPSRKAWKEAAEHLPPEVDSIRERMRTNSLSTETLHELEVKEDLFN